VTLGEGQQLDFGGIAKGYTSAAVMDVFREYGITSGMVSLGGNVQVLNRKTDGTCWKIGIQDPASETGSVLAAVEVENCAVITSGGYQRYFEQDGNTYIHIIDPRTGYPVEGDLTSVTIISEDGTMADALSTSLYIMGLERAIAYWQSEAESFDMILVTVDGKLYVTEGISGQLTTEKEVTVVNR
jgi:thiamine biosynthesis lipoprotein